VKIVSIIGARPQLIKAATLSPVLDRAQHDERILHTGQHYDHELSRVFIDELRLPSPHYNLGVGSGSHGYQTGEMLKGIEDVLRSEAPDMVLLYGDTNSTLAGALAAAKLNILIGHVEAGVRHYDRRVPEEINRVLADHVSSLLFCPTKRAVSNLALEGITEGVYWTGDIMYDSILRHAEVSARASTVLEDFGLQAQGYYLATVHRPSNTDTPEHLVGIFDALRQLDLPVVFPMHPRTRLATQKLGLLDRLSNDRRLKVIPPQGYLDFLELQRNARLILTDSGGVQKEALFLSTPCVTLREYSPWPETVESGWNVLVPPCEAAILKAVAQMTSVVSRSSCNAFGDGHAAESICRVLAEHEGMTHE